jgi:hypothetical protein
MTETTPLAPASADRFWPGYVAAAILAPLVWIILEGLTMPDWVVSFYLVSIGAVPVVFAAVVLRAWRYIRTAPGAAASVGAAVLALPSVAIVLWGTYTAVWLLYLLLTGQT